jgi:hypothetical protein
VRGALLRYRNARSGTAAPYSSRVEQDEPQNWRLDVPQACIDLYVDLSARPRALSADEAQMLVQLVDAWRGLGHRKHIVLEAARRAPGVPPQP